MAKVKRSGSGVEVIRYSGDAWVSLLCEESTTGTLRSLVTPHYEFSADACILVRAGLYVLPIDEVTLRTESDFHASRHRIMFSALFENNSDLMELLRQAALVVAIVLAVVVLFQFSSVSGTLSHLQAAVDKLSK